MASNEYHFVTTWRVPASADAIAAILADAEALPRWWPSVYLSVRVLDPGGPDGLGKVVDLWTTGWLPYTLRWQFRVIASDPPRGFTIDASGDFVGQGTWTLIPEGPTGDSAEPPTTVVYDWRIRAEKGILRRLSFMARPIFAANHRWAMARGQESLRIELARRHALADPLTRGPAPAPRGPTFRRRSQAAGTWGRSFDPTRLARLELRMWQTYYRRQPARLFGLLVLANREQARVGWGRALLAALWLTRGAVGFARSSGDYERFRPDIERGYRALGLPATVDAADVARRELRWWVVRREIGLAAGEAAGAAITALYAGLYGVEEERVAEAGRLRGLAAEVRDRGAAADLDGPTGAGRAYWPEVGRLLRDSYQSLHAALERAGSQA